MVTSIPTSHSLMLSWDAVTPISTELLGYGQSSHNSRFRLRYDTADDLYVTFISFGLSFLCTFICMIAYSLPKNTAFLQLA